MPIIIFQISNKNEINPLKIKTKTNDADKIYNNNNNDVVKEKKCPCIRTKEDIRGKKPCRYLHPWDTGFEKTCKHTYKNCQYYQQGHCRYAQHPYLEFSSSRRRYRYF